MSPPPPAPLMRILVVEDEEAHAELIRRAFEQMRAAFALTMVRRLDEARAQMAVELPDLVITDLVLPDGRGTGLLGEQRVAGKFPLMVMTSQGDERAAVDAMKAGALDYVVKSDAILASMPQLAERALREWNHLMERAQLEEQMRSAQRMEAMGTLASGVAHDYNNLLTGLLGCMTLARDSLTADSPARLYLEEGRRAAMRGATLTRQLLTFCRRRGSARGDLALDAVIADLERIMRSVLGERIRLRVRLDATGLHVAGDRGQMEQVLLNLAINARDAMPDGGELRVETEAVDLDAETARLYGLASTRCAIVRVLDTGSGMDADTQQRVFDPFFTTKGPERGTGLGLASAWGIIKENGGHILVDSELGVGTAFTLYLPIVEPSEQPETDRSAVEARPGSETILVVDDEPLVRLTLRSYLEPLGYEILEACDAGEASMFIRETNRRIDLMIVDVMLPGAWGLEVADELRRTRGHTPVLFMSAHPADLLTEEGRVPAGVTPLSKPFRDDQLMLQLHALLGERRRTGPSRSTHTTNSADTAVTACVLLVEDGDTTRMAMTELLRQAGHRVLAARNGREALTLFGKEPDVEVLVTDIGLPDMSGLELAGLLRRQRPSLAVVVTSGQSEHDPAVQSLLAERRSTFVQKPIDVDDLCETIAELLRDR